MDSSKCIATSRQLSYLIVALGLIAFFAAWAKHAQHSWWRTDSFLTKVIVVSDVLKRGKWTSGYELTPYALAGTFSSNFVQFYIVNVNDICATPPEESVPQNQASGFRTHYTDIGHYMPPMTYFDISSKRLISEKCREVHKDFQSNYPSLTSPDKIPNARLFTRIDFPGDNVFGCSFVVFRGTDDQSYNIPALYILGARREIHGSAIYTVFFNDSCVGQNRFDPPVPFILIDDTQITGSWYSGVPGWATGVPGWAKQSAVADNFGYWISHPRFDMHLLSTEALVGFRGGGFG